MYSVIVNSIDPEKLARLRANLNRVLRHLEWEMIHIPNATGMCEGYNRGLSAAKGERLIFCHDDIEFAGDEIGAALDQGFAYSDMFGVIGTRQMVGGNFMTAGIPNGLGLWIQTGEDGLLALCTLGIESALMHGAQGLDGLFIATHRSVAQQLRWDDVTFAGWHGYDTDFSYRAFRAGFRVAVSAVLPIVHNTKGHFKDANYIEAVDAFGKKHPETNLPDYCAGHLGSLMFPGYHTTQEVVNALRENFAYLVQRTGEVRSQFLHPNTLSLLN